jgi:hypothetical protein
MSIYNLDEVMKLTLQGNFEAYVNGTYEKRPILNAWQFSRAHGDLEFKGFGGDVHQEKIIFLRDISGMLQDFLYIFRDDKEECLDYAEKITNIIHILLDTEDGYGELEDWAILQYQKLREHYFLKIWVAFRDMRSNELFDTAVENSGNVDEAESDVEYMFWVVRSYTDIIRVDEKEEKEQEFLRVFGIQE